jgi:hypothetical protein
VKLHIFPHFSLEQKTKKIAPKEKQTIAFQSSTDGGIRQGNLINIVIGKVRRLGGENGQFRPYRASNA